MNIRPDKTVLLAVALLLMTTAVWAQQASECMDLVRATYYKMNHPETALKKGVSYLMECDVKTAPRDSQEVNLFETSIRFHMDKSSFVYQSDQMSYFNDGKHAATVVPGRRLVYYTDQAKLENQKEIQERMFAMQDSLLRYARVESCTQTCLDNGRQAKVIRMSIDPRWQVAFQATAMTVTIDIEEEKMHQVRIDHPPMHPNVYSVYTYRKLDYNSRLPVLEGGLKQKLFAGGKTLRGEYKEYKLVNLNESHVE